MDSWSIDQKRRHYLTLPWTVSVTLEDGDFVGRIAEFPGLVAVAAAYDADGFQSVIARSSAATRTAVAAA